ncbi:hypothetical protein AWQ21_15525 (plasmid) [Picosynechococcus sp. PCC 7003]|uniref:hypothetical protein n=1 Tax=Picosynechococcus sp. PCC 7003 TaxID=374981 RepID=UPI0008108CEC|nr:hypothetical protein [Picosynechococcus sp. PCC 7003]ANV85935.1 hypothetical protein AWQ21_15525 [Picosynechococcus sp. PCC 7003]
MASQELNQLRQQLGQIPPQSPERRRTLRQMGIQIQQSKGGLNHKLTLWIDQAKAIEEDLLPPILKTLCQRELLAQAIALIEQSGKLWQNYNPLDEDAYREAYLKTLEYFYRHYQDYDPSQAQVTTWLNFRLKNEFKTQQTKQYHRQQRQANAQSDAGEDLDLFNLLESPSDGEAARQMKTGIETWIATDPELPTVTIKNKPALSAQWLLQARFIEEQEWGQLAKKCGVTVATLSSFYERQCRGRLITFIEANYDFIPPDSPINPCEHLRGLLKDKALQKQHFEEKFNHWLATDPHLQTLTLRQKPSITAPHFLKTTLAILQKPRQGLTQVAAILEVDPKYLERFYEFHLLPFIQAFVHKIRREGR